MKSLLPEITSADKRFHAGNPAMGEQGTRVTDVWLNDVQDRLRDVQAEAHYVLQKAGFTPKAEQQTQLYQAIIKIINDNRNTASVTQRGEVQLSSADNSDSETTAATSKVVKKLKNLIDGITQSLKNYITNDKKSSAINSTSNDHVATSAAVKTAYDKGTEALAMANKAKATADTKAPTVDPVFITTSTVNNLNNINGTRVLSFFDTATGIPNEWVGTGADFNGVQVDTAIQKFIFVVSNEKDIQLKYNDNGTTWTDWNKFVMTSGDFTLNGDTRIPNLRTRNFYSSSNDYIDFYAQNAFVFYGSMARSKMLFEIKPDYINNYKSVTVNDGSEYSSIWLYNKTNHYARLEVAPHSSGNFAAILYNDQKNNIIYRNHFPKATGTLALTSDLTWNNIAGKPQVVSDIRLGAATHRNLGTDSWDIWGQGCVITGFHNGPDDLNANDKVFMRPIQKYINGAWVTIANA